MATAPTRTPSAPLTADAPAPAEPDSTAASTAPTSGAAASRTEPSDLLIVQRGATPYKATAEQLKSYMLTPATAAAIGAIKPGTNLSVDADGTLHAAISGALTYRGAIDPTTSEAPAGAAVGDVYLASSSGIALASWSGIAGAEIAQGDLLLFDGSSWSANAALGPDGAGVIRIQVAAPLAIDESDPAQPLLTVEPATTAAAGVLRLAAAEDLTAGTEGAAVDAAALKAAMATAQPAGDYMPLDISTLPALPRWAGPDGHPLNRGAAAPFSLGTGHRIGCLISFLLFRTPPITAHRLLP